MTCSLPMTRPEVCTPIPSRILIPCFSKALRNKPGSSQLTDVLQAGPQSPEFQRPLKIEANSHPIGPPPTTKALLATRLIFGSLSELKISGSSSMFRCPISTMNGVSLCSLRHTLNSTVPYNNTLGTVYYNYNVPVIVL